MINGDKLLDYIGALNMCDEISNEAYMKIMAHCEEQEPCDCISREETIKKINTLIAEYIPLMPTGWTLPLNIARMINELPPVTPQPKVGEWLEKEVNSDKIEEWQSARCSKCNLYHTTPYSYYFDDYNYCPNCGAKMEGRKKVDQRRSKGNS